MQHRNLFASILLLSLAGVTVAACTDDRGGDAGRVVGAARYGDATTDASGAPHEAASPPAQSAALDVIVSGTGVATGVQPTCLDAATGRFDASYAGQLAIGDGGSFASSLDAAAMALTTPSGCVIPQLAVSAITSITVRAELQATTSNCQSYCAASARADAEAECHGQADQVSCRAQAEAAAQASCTTTCTQQAHAIAAETTVGVGALADLDADALRAAALGDLSASLTFDHLVDAQGQTIGQ